MISLHMQDRDNWNYVVEKAMTPESGEDLYLKVVLIAFRRPGYS